MMMKLTAEQVWEEFESLDEQQKQIFLLHVSKEERWISEFPELFTGIKMLAKDETEHRA